MAEDYLHRIRNKALRERVVTAEKAADLIRDGMVLGMSGFTRAGEAKAVPLALAERARRAPLKVTLMTGASLGNDLDKQLAEAHVTARRIPFMSDPSLRRAINAGEVMYIDQHLSETVEQLRTCQLPPVDIAIIEAAAITESGGIIPTTSVGNSASFALLAEKVIVEINLNQSEQLEGLHDIYIPTYRPSRTPIPVVTPESRVGFPFIPVPPERIAAIVVSTKLDSAANVSDPDEGTQAIAGHLTEFLKNEVAHSRLPSHLHPLQAGIGTIANAVLHGFIDSPFHDLTMYSEVLQDSTFDLMDAGKMIFASGSSITLSAPKYRQVMERFQDYKPKLVLRPQEISNHPEVVRRLGLICINTALEFDIYGNVNSTHVMGSNMMNGIGGSGDFARNAFLSVFVTKSIAKNGRISSVVPMVSHVDHTEHDVDILVTEQGLADLRGLAPRERARVIMANCVDPDWRDGLEDYFTRALVRGGHTPHLLEEALSWHDRLRRTGTMKPE
ncbi:acetyl-CoA hydrolase/transferase family protein [Paracoccus sp. CPCC 101403]|uniref:Acetyl-CoA hydrolase/transferase family protein n=1 Tax=Paracoccus broussonetiae TaxID=3075834 RepID=A0ABU3EEI8_9RHOB|nr:acetyl-CoA hydrolase/transferase family protein [Paracoccus sp. CPCC 101403]MDT1061835.1 acetyl-CoA hydrolase/transferase family protein [Paracoccus sp. CPCC 101403]